MIDITIPAEKRIKIAAEYYSRLTQWIDNNGYWAGLGDAKADEMMGYIQSHAREFFLVPADKLKTKSGEFETKYRTERCDYKATKGDAKKSTSYGLFVLRMRSIYKDFFQELDENGVKNGYWLMRKLGITVCPYCNRNYTITVHSKDIQVRPDFDHFYPEAKYPSLILSFYNLVPSCPQCNHLKRVQEIEVNPWFGYKTIPRPKFKVDTAKGVFPERPFILIDNENANTKKLGIKELYNEHTDYVKDILNKIQAYNPATYRAIVKDFQGIVNTESGLQRMIWGNYTDLAYAGKRPFAKLTADILEQYKKYL